LRRRLTVSREKVEKVVKPPQNPTVRKILIPVLLRGPNSKRKIVKPRSKLPMIFTARVPNGKDGGRKRKTRFEIK